MKPAPSLTEPFYYLENFRQVIDWVESRYSSFLASAEVDFIAGFRALSTPSAALLVRMVMRKGEFFRLSRLAYPEIGCAETASLELREKGFVSIDPELDLDAVYRLSVKSEFCRLARDWTSPAGLSKYQLYQGIAATEPGLRPWSDWLPGSGDAVVRLNVQGVIDRLRVLFFGNSRQGWTDFILADLGLFNYETVPLPPNGGAFADREELEAFLAIEQTREALDQLDTDDEEGLSALLTSCPPPPQTPWLAERHHRLTFESGLACERRQRFDDAQECYGASGHSQARFRHIRVLERLGRIEHAMDIALEASRAPRSEEELQCMGRVIPRLRRKLGHSTPKPKAAPLSSITLTLARQDAGVEICAAEALATADAPVFYVENTLISGLLGLLCWDLVFAPVPGAFFHPFQRAPADLHRPSFSRDRREQLAECWEHLNNGTYKKTIIDRYNQKHGLQNPFVSWQALNLDTIKQALDHIPPEHLRCFFERILADIKANRSGLPDLIQFNRCEGGYRLIEVKGPGDRLQDNQVRWLQYCVANEIPVAVCYVSWESP